MFAGKHIVLGVTGGIAAYKSALLVREFVRAGAEVQVVMTQAATHFITPLTLGTLSRRDVIVEMFPTTPGEATSMRTKHVDLGVWADVMLVAPASANTIAKIVHGVADNFLTTLVLALRCPLLLAPAMDLDMWSNETTQRNVSLLKQRGCHMLAPESGELASGLSGPGRLPEVDTILKFVQGVMDNHPGDMRGKRVLVTAGPTEEPLDPVRYIGNRSSGKMGFAVAAAAAQRGADVTLIAGPVHLETPLHIRRVNVVTAQEMYEAVHAEFAGVDLVVMAAAVADFAPVAPSRTKIKRDAVPGGRMTIDLKQNPDILRSLGEKKGRQVLVGFALETDDGVQNARTKLATKRLDAVVLNNPTDEGSGFGADTNVVTVITAGGLCERLPKMLKFDVANTILDRVLPLLR